MRVFECMLKLVFKRPVYFIVYGVCLSFMGVFMALSLPVESAPAEYEAYDAAYAVIDRDESPVSAGIAAFLAEEGTEVPLADERFALADAVAKGRTDYILIIPQDYGDAFLEAARAGQDVPDMECVYGFYSAEGAKMDAALSNYLSALATYAAALPDASASRIADLALSSTARTAQVDVIAPENPGTEVDRYVCYMQFDIYVFFAGITVCIGIALATMNRTDIRRRNLSSPLPYLSYNLQVALACLVVALAFCALTLTLGFIAFPASIAALGPVGVACMAGIAVAFSLVPLGAGYLLGQLGIGATAANAVGNILGLVLSFLGGSWIPLDIMAPEVAAVSHFLPGFWYTDALSATGVLAAGDLSVLPRIAGDLGVIALFAAALIGAGLVVGKMRTQTAEAGGNAAAQASVELS